VKAARVRRPLAFLLVVSSALIGLLAIVPAASAAAAAPLSSVKVSGDIASKPTLKFAKPFAVKKTADKVVTPGTGAALTSGQTITFDYVLVDGRSGNELQTSFGQTQGSLTLDKTKTATPLVTSLTGQNLGSRVLVAIAPKDGLAKRIKSAKVKQNDTLLFVIDLKSVRKPLARATGAPVAPVAGLPTVALAADGKPTITVPAGAAAPTQLVSQVLIKGTGPAVTSGQTISVHYTGVIWGTGKQFDSSWDRGTPLDTVIGKGQVISGWDEGLVGQTVGSQVLLVVPPDKGYGSAGQSQAGISGTDTLVFVVDILDAY
jgi:peptidylprolyl isomerase